MLTNGLSLNRLRHLLRSVEERAYWDLRRIRLIAITVITALRNFKAAVSYPHLLICWEGSSYFTLFFEAR